jgi:hypothetical protein
MAQNSETKKRLLLSKWRTSQDEGVRLRAEIEELESARDEAWHDVEVLQDERNSLQSELDDLQGTPAMCDVLTDVKYWLHDGLVMHRLVSDPRQLLRKVEDVLG